MIVVKRVHRQAILYRLRIEVGDNVFEIAREVLVDRIEVDDRQIRILSRKDVLEAAATANGGPVPGVRSIVPKWRTQQDSNL